jgi:protein transport protein HofB
LLQQVGQALDVNTLGMQPLQLADFAHALQQPQGLVLVTGPTGSGKTVTLYSALQKLNTADINICSVEDPVEIPIAGLNQTQIHPRAGLTFQGVLRALLRQDPDVIMIGEIRDGETAEIAIKAAQTGHLVLSTLHTNSTCETLVRLQQMGVAIRNETAFPASSTVNCPSCGRRCSAISRFPSTFNLAVNATPASGETSGKGCNTPSIRKRMR